MHPQPRQPAGAMELPTKPNNARTVALVYGARRLANGGSRASGGFSIVAQQEFARLLIVVIEMADQRGIVAHFPDLSLFRDGKYMDDIVYVKVSEHRYMPHESDAFEV